MMVLILVTLLLALAVLSFWRLAKGKTEPGAKYPRSLPSLPIIGSLLYLAHNPQLHLLFHSLQKKYGSLYSLRMGSHYMVVVNHHLHAREVLLKKGKIFGGRPHTVTTDMLTRDGKDIAFASYSPLWKLQRKKVHAALAMLGKGSESLEKIIYREAAAMCETLSASQDTSLNMAPELTRSVTNVVCSLCFSSCYCRGDAEFETMLEYSQGIVDTVSRESLVDIFPWLQYFPNKDLALLKRCIMARDQLLQKKFEEHKEALSNSLVSDLMDALLHIKLNTENNNSRLAKQLELTDDHLLMTVADIFGAGVETTTTVLKWTVLFLLHYPKVQRKIQEELDQKIGFARYPQLSDREQLPYLEATISEVMRIRPVAPLLIPHVALTDASIGEYTIPKGAQVIINLWSIHHDEKEWEKPGDFNPGRFLDEQGKRLHTPFPSYLPFGSGIRVCLGEVLARMELFLFMAWILQRFTLEPPPGQSLPEPDGKFGVVLQVPPFMVKARLRDAWRNAA